jgi:hypothetical protein
VVFQLVFLHCCICNGRSRNWKMGPALYYALSRLATKIRAPRENSRLANVRGKSGWGQGIRSWETKTMSKSAPCLIMFLSVNAIDRASPPPAGWDLTYARPPEAPPLPHSSSSSGAPRSRRGHRCPLSLPPP